ncbi:hypothetical protein Gpo141_00004128 [Globisporangium polare]
MVQGETPTRRITRGQLLHLVRRVLVLALYIVISIQSVVLSTLILNGTAGPLATFSTDEATLIPHYVGKATTRESVLLREVLDAKLQQGALRQRRKDNPEDVYIVTSSLTSSSKAPRLWSRSRSSTTFESPA